MRSMFQRTMQVVTVVGVAAAAWKVTGAPWYIF
jgi:hypothetical protein